MISRNGLAGGVFCIVHTLAYFNLGHSTGKLFLFLGRANDGLRAYMESQARHEFVLVAVVAISRQNEQRLQ
jgi:hypothetical protein